jgi:hypothetical protein
VLLCRLGIVAKPMRVGESDDEGHDRYRQASDADVGERQTETQALSHDTSSMNRYPRP